jgi:hypothetical protein
MAAGSDNGTSVAGRAESYRQARERFSRSLGGPYRDSVFFELLSLDHLET